MSILSELKKLTGKQNAKVVSEALPNNTAGGVLVCHLNREGDTMMLDKTWAEIKNAALNGLSVKIVFSEIFTNSGLVDCVYLSRVDWKHAPTIVDPMVYYVHFFAIDSGSIVELSFSTDSEDGYPVMYDQASLTN